LAGSKASNPANPRPIIRHYLHRARSASNILTSASLPARCRSRPGNARNARAVSRALVEAQDLTTEAGRAMFAAPGGLAGADRTAFCPAFDSLSRQLRPIWSRNAIERGACTVDAQIEASNAAANQARHPHRIFFQLGRKPAITGESQHRGRYICIRDLAGAAQRFASLFCAKRSAGNLDALGESRRRRGLPWATDKRGPLPQTATEAAPHRGENCKPSSARLRRYPRRLAGR